ncbi:hypothetical protein HNR71_001198 [Kribbella sandramycini]|uniref:Uncharacterized protein n=1 Tax=Kribbella sandramycini TaxID=60450 RepID=A0A841S658_9ACTN|nr:hypothetical protein [Kribbella sandramycini]
MRRLLAAALTLGVLGTQLVATPAEAVGRGEKCLEATGPV